MHPIMNTVAPAPRETPKWHQSPHDRGAPARVPPRPRPPAPLTLHGLAAVQRDLAFALRAVRLHRDELAAGDCAVKFPLRAPGRRRGGRGGRRAGAGRGAGAAGAARPARAVDEHVGDGRDAGGQRTREAGARGLHGARPGPAAGLTAAAAAPAARRPPPPARPPGARPGAAPWAAPPRPARSRQRTSRARSGLRDRGAALPGAPGSLHAADLRAPRLLRGPTPPSAGGGGRPPRLLLGPPRAPTGGRPRGEGDRGARRAEGCGHRRAGKGRRVWVGATGWDPGGGLGEHWCASDGGKAAWRRSRPQQVCVPHPASVPCPQLTTAACGAPESPSRPVSSPPWATTPEARTHLCRPADPACCPHLGSEPEASALHLCPAQKPALAPQYLSRPGPRSQPRAKLCGTENQQQSRHALGYLLVPPPGRS